MSEEPKPELWRGIGKLVEECGEVLQLCGKLFAFPYGDHPDDNGDLAIRIEEELADLHAAMRYFILMNEIDVARINARSEKKLARFYDWVLTGLKP
jgi:NTP pyrophosphatase (non-canonical NTP hydrolase)